MNDLVKSHSFKRPDYYVCKEKDCYFSQLFFMMHHAHNNDFSLTAVEVTDIKNLKAHVAVFGNDFTKPIFRKEVDPFSWSLGFYKPEIMREVAE